MKRLVFTPLASEDIRNIWDYTERQWSLSQAKIYIRQLQTDCENLAQGNAVARPTNIRPGYFKYASGSHMIYFRKSEGEIIIIRILHQSMDVMRHL